LLEFIRVLIKASLFGKGSGKVKIVLLSRLMRMPLEIAYALKSTLSGDPGDPRAPCRAWLQIVKLP
jgi:hypothetical protein